MLISFGILRIHTVWIDMESSLRDDPGNGTNFFSLEKVQKCIDIALTFGLLQRPKEQIDIGKLPPTVA
jgi:hypothetical protein